MLTTITVTIVVPLSAHSIEASKGVAEHAGQQHMITGPPLAVQLTARLEYTYNQSVLQYSF